MIIAGFVTGTIIQVVIHAIAGARLNPILLVVTGIVALLGIVMFVIDKVRNRK
jgi:predicted membrane channel-forming protein YqfA (hemolysin III family)